MAPRGRKGWAGGGGGGGGQGKEGGVGSSEREGVFVMDKMAGERERFQRRVDGMVGVGLGGGGGEVRSACVITREENGRVSLQVASSRCGSNAASSDLVFVFCLYCAVYVIMDSYSFSYSSWCTGYQVKSLNSGQRGVHLSSIAEAVH